jgi:catechol 2,3-dioxygenase-like lactoylglutathione lyase family enzyme
MALKNALAFIAVRDIEAATRWYTMLLGREPDTQPMKGLAEWQFEAGGWLQVHENKQMAGRSSVTFVETDVDDRIKQLQTAGIAPKSAMRDEQVSLVIITDPDGNQIVFAQGKGEKHRAVNGEATISP